MFEAVPLRFAAQVTHEPLETRVVKILQEYQTLLEQGALAGIDEQKSRIRILPLR